jgi:adenosylcobinamide-phosphate synthase
MSAIGALATDFVAGEPPTSVHPTIWMGRWIGSGQRRRLSARSSRKASLLEGAMLVGGGVLLAAISARAVSRTIERMPRRTRGALRALALKPALSLRPLLEAAAEVQDHLQSNRLEDARRTLGFHLVSRETGNLFPSEVSGAAIESVAENLSDSVIAPLLAYRVGGLTAAYAYRMINTADAMLGYRTPELEWFGKAAARVDDVANLLPSRITAALICACAVAGDGSPREAARVALRDARLTTSPNAGWPMSAMAGALGVRLTKRELYALNIPARRPRPSDIGRACRIALAVSSISALLVDVL